MSAGILKLQRLNDANLALKAAVVEGQHCLGVGEHHIVLALEGLGKMRLDATGEGALDVGVGGVGPDLVKGEPVGHLVGVLLKAEGGKVHKGVDGLAVEEVALLKERKRRVKVMQRDERLNMVLMALGEEIVVELDALGVDFAVPLVKMRLQAMERRMPLMPNSSHSSKSTGYWL